MNKLILKTIFLLLVLLMLGLIFMNNKQNTELVIPKLPKIKQPAAIMYFGFFAVGVLTGTILTAGKKGGAAKSKGE